MLIANQAYGTDLGRLEACIQTIVNYRRLVDREEYAVGYNPYQNFADALKTNFPEVWEGNAGGSARKALEPWGVT